MDQNKQEAWVPNLRRTCTSLCDGMRCTRAIFMAAGVSTQSTLTATAVRHLPGCSLSLCLNSYPGGVLRNRALLCLGNNFHVPEECLSEFNRRSSETDGAPARHRSVCDGWAKSRLDESDPPRSPLAPHNSRTVCVPHSIEFSIRREKMGPRCILTVIPRQKHKRLQQGEPAGRILDCALQLHFSIVNFEHQRY
eukprot:1160112-Pelagomonas_calceolata.AAC.10